MPRNGAKRKGASIMHNSKTTAELLVEFRKELLNGGFTVDAAERIATIAAHKMIEESGLAVQA